MAATQQISVAGKDSIARQGESPAFDSGRTLEEITRSAQHLTSASGAALVLSDGKVMSCRACSGELVPPPGTQLNTDTGFTATCVRTAEVVRCDDTGTDPRVDGSICIELGIRSILAVPIFNAQKVAGVLEVLSHEPNRFTDRHATALKLLARLVETLVNYVSRGDGSGVASIPDPKPQGKASGTNTDEARVACLTCGHPNPQGSQFCNRCGVILLISPTSLDTTADLDRPGGTELSADKGLTEICKLISGNAGLATWNEIYAKLLANMQSTSEQNDPYRTTTEETAKTEDTAMGFGRARRPAEQKTRPGAAVRRNLWL
jgi:hypothetical protein